MDNNTLCFFGGIFTVLFIFLLLFFIDVVGKEKYVLVNIDDATGNKIVKYEKVYYKLTPLVTKENI